MTDLQDRAAGCLAGLAYGDALGVPYENGTRALDGRPKLLGGGLGATTSRGSGATTPSSRSASRWPRSTPTCRAKPAWTPSPERFEDCTPGARPMSGSRPRECCNDAELRDGPPGRAATRGGPRLARSVRAQRPATAPSCYRPVALALARRCRGDCEGGAGRRRAHPFGPARRDSCVLWCLAIDAALAGRRTRPGGPCRCPAGRTPRPVGGLDRRLRTVLPPSTFAETATTVTALASRLGPASANPRIAA